MAQERVDGLTPNGGDYSILYFMDINHREVEKEKATHFELVEYDNEGEQVFRTYGELPSLNVSSSGFA